MLLFPGLLLNVAVFDCVSTPPSSMERRRLNDGLEVTCIGRLYKGPLEKKYWSSSRGKDRYPFPVGYRAVRSHTGRTYHMEVCEGARGPSFVVSQGEDTSCSAETPTIAWENIIKKESSRARKMHRILLSTNMNGAELFGFLNPLVQRLFRELASSNQVGDAQPSTRSVHIKAPLETFQRKQDNLLTENATTYGNPKSVPAGLSWRSEGSIPVRRSRTSIVRAGQPRVASLCKEVLARRITEPHQSENNYAACSLDMQAAGPDKNCISTQTVTKGKKQAKQDRLEKLRDGEGFRKRLKLAKPVRKTTDVKELCNHMGGPLFAPPSSTDKAQSQCGIESSRDYATQPLTAVLSSDNVNTGFPQIVPDSLEGDCTVMAGGEMDQQNCLKDVCALANDNSDKTNKSMKEFCQKHAYEEDCENELSSLKLSKIETVSFENSLVIRDGKSTERKVDHSDIVDSFCLNSCAMDTSKKISSVSPVGRSSEMKDKELCATKNEDTVVYDMDAVIPDSFDDLSSQVLMKRGHENKKICPVQALSLNVRRHDESIEVPAVGFATALSVPASLTASEKAEVEMINEVKSLSEHVLKDECAEVPETFYEKSYQPMLEIKDDEMCRTSNAEVGCRNGISCDECTKANAIGAASYTQNICNALEDESQHHDLNSVVLKSEYLHLKNIVVPDSFDAQLTPIPKGIGSELEFKNPVPEKVAFSLQDAYGMKKPNSSPQDVYGTMKSNSEIRGKVGKDGDLKASGDSQSSEGKMERGESDSLGQELTKSMISLLLPQVAQLLNKDGKRKAKQILSSHADAYFSPNVKEGRGMANASEVPATNETPTLLTVKDCCNEPLCIIENEVDCVELAGEEVQLMLDSPCEKTLHQLSHSPQVGQNSKHALHTEEQTVCHADADHACLEDTVQLQDFGFEGNVKPSCKTFSLEGEEPALDIEKVISIRDQARSTATENTLQDTQNTMTILAELSYLPDAKPCEILENIGPECHEAGANIEQQQNTNSSEDHATFCAKEMSINPPIVGCNTLPQVESLVIQPTESCCVKGHCKETKAIEGSVPQKVPPKNVVLPPSPCRLSGQCDFFSSGLHMIGQRDLHLKPNDEKPVDPSSKPSGINSVTVVRQTTAKVNTDDQAYNFEVSKCFAFDAAATAEKDLMSNNHGNLPASQMDKLKDCHADVLTIINDLPCIGEDLLTSVSPEMTDIYSQGIIHTMERPSGERVLDDDTRSPHVEAGERNRQSIMHDLPVQRDQFEPIGCLEHPFPILAMKMNVQGELIRLCVCCGLQKTNPRVLFLYESIGREFKPMLIANINIEVSDPAPAYMALSLEENGIQLTPDGHKLVLLDIFSIQGARDTTQDAKIHGNEKDKDIYGINLVSYEHDEICVCTKLNSGKRLYCLLLPEPYVIVAAGEEGCVRGWTMESDWRNCKESFTLPMVTCEGQNVSHVVQLLAVPNMPCVVLGCDDVGLTAIWNVSKRQLLVTFKLPVLPPHQVHVLNHGITDWGGRRDVSNIKFHAAENLGEDGDDANGIMTLCLLVSSLLYKGYPLADSCTEAASSKKWSLFFVKESGKITELGLDQMSQRVCTVNVMNSLGVAGTKEGCIYLWDIISGSIKIKLDEFEGVPIACIASSFDHNMIAVAGINDRVFLYM